MTLVTSKALPSVPAPLLQSWYLLCDLLSVISSVSPPAAYLVIWSQDKSLKLPTTTHFTTQPTQGHRLFAQFLHKTTQMLDKIFISVHCVLHHLYNISLKYMIAFYVEHFYTGHRKILIFSGFSVQLNLSVYWNTFYSFEEYKIIERNILGTLKGNQNKAAKTLTVF